jgi:hypothetical protein
MNRIRLNRLFIAGLVTLLAFIVIELVWEGLIGRLLLSEPLEALASYPEISTWTLRHHAINILIALGNCLMLIWLYASLRPMFGVGTRAALIASAFMFVFVFAFELNYTNLGVLPLRLAILDAVNLIVELPLALIAGAHVYESGRWSLSEG